MDYSLAPINKANLGRNVKRHAGTEKVLALYASQPQMNWNSLYKYWNKQEFKKVKWETGREMYKKIENSLLRFSNFFHGIFTTFDSIKLF